MNRFLDYKLEVVLGGLALVVGATVGTIWPSEGTREYRIDTELPSPRVLVPVQQEPEVVTTRAAETTVTTATTVPTTVTEPRPLTTMPEPVVVVPPTTTTRPTTTTTSTIPGGQTPTTPSTLPPECSPEAGCP